MTVSQLFDLSNDVAVVTGAGRGIGEGIARTLASAGAAAYAPPVVQRKLNGSARLSTVRAVVHWPLQQMLLTTMQ